MKRPPPRIQNAFAPVEKPYQVDVDMNGTTQRYFGKLPDPVKEPALSNDARLSINIARLIESTDRLTDAVEKLTVWVEMLEVTLRQRSGNG